jgi:two-component system phosphate regulon sensor histidine kinase PhoR
LKTIFGRSFSGFLVVILILAVLAPVLIFNTIKSKFNSLATSNLTRTAETLEFIFTPLLGNEPAELDSIADELGKRLNLRITLITRNGIVLADSDEQPDSMENHRTRPEVICAFNGMIGTSSRYSATLDRDMLYVAVPAKIGDSIPAVIRTSLFLSDQKSILHSVISDIAIVMLAVLFAGLIIAWLFSRSFADPIRNIADATRKVEEGDYSIRIAPCSISELSRLSSDINGMISRTDELIEELSGKNASLDAILESVVEGLVVIDAGGIVITTNRSFRRMSGAGERGEGCTYLDFISIGEFRDFIAGVLNRGIISGEISFDGNVFSARAAKIPETDQFVITFRDITEIAEAVRVKKEFADNASHELRTPLTSIKGYGETILDNLSGEDRKYMGIILRNTDRLIRIVDDIRVLSELEHPMTTLDVSEVNLEDVVNNTIELFRTRAEEKSLDLIVEKETQIPVVRADRFRIEQVLINLFDNAIRYTSSGAVTVRIGARGHFVTIVVSDTGIGIEENHLTRLFERFYVVDKARSRSRGGTGLGLAIVKHIVTLHGGWVRVSSTPGSGTMFTIGLPEQAPSE